MSSTADQLRCPLCHATRTRIVETLDAEQLARAYQSSFGVQTSLGHGHILYAHCAACDLRFFTPPHAGDAELYVQLQRNEWYYMEAKSEYAIAAGWLPCEGAVLEVGSGRGAFADTVGRRRYTGLEFNDAAIERAAAQGINLRKESVQDHAAASHGTYAAVVSFQVLEHVTDPHSFIAACVEALAPGGTLVLAVPDHDGLCGLTQNEILDLPPHHVSHWTAQALEHIGPLFGVEWLENQREPLAPHHAPSAAKAIVERRLRRRAGLPPRLLDMSLPARAVGRLAARWSRLFPPSLAGMSGHTILARYRKPDAAGRVAGGG